MKKLTRTAQRGFTLIELMIVVAIIGILAAVAIPMFLDSMKSAKSSEARVQLTKMRDRAKTTYLTDNNYPNQVTALTPATTCCVQDIGGKKRCKGASPGDWDVPSWQALDFEIDEDFFFQYQYTGGGTGPASTYSMSAVGDLDCDLTTITYTVTGSVTAAGQPEAVTVDPAPNTD